VAALVDELARVFPALAGAGHKIAVAYRTSLGEAPSPAALWRRSNAAGREIRRGLTLVGHTVTTSPSSWTALIRARSARAASSGCWRLALRLAEVLPVTEAAGHPPPCAPRRCVVGAGRVVGGNVLREIQSVEQCSSRPLSHCGERRRAVDR